MAFIRGNQVYKVSVDGGSPQTLGMAPGTFNGASWSKTGVIVVSGNTALYVIPETGGAARLLGDRARVTGELYRDAPLVVDDAGVVLYSSWNTSSLTSARIAIASLATGEATALDLRGIQPLGLVNGTLLYVTAAGTIMGAPVDVAGRRLLGPPVQLVDNVVVNNSTGLARATVSSRTLFYQSGTQVSQVVVVGPGGSKRVILGDRRDYSFPRLSPDGRRLAITMGVSDKRDVWLHDFGPGTLTRLTTEGTTNERPEWSPDGSRVLFRSDNETRTSIWWRPADLSARATPLLTGPRLDVFEAVLTPDARTIVYQLDTLGADIYYRALSGDTTPKPVAASTTAIESMPRLSPDGRWIAFTTDESGRNEVVVQPFPGPGGRSQVSVTGGTEPLWARDGRRLFYRGDGRLMAAVLRPGAIVRGCVAGYGPHRQLCVRGESACELRRDGGWEELHLSRGGVDGRYGRGVELGCGGAGSYGGDAVGRGDAREPRGGAAGRRTAADAPRRRHPSALGHDLSGARGQQLGDLSGRMVTG